MSRQRVLAIGLDGYEASVGDTLMAQGKLMNLRALKENSARYFLDHGMEKYTGLGGEHFSSGQSPKTSGRWTAVHFDQERYDVVQRGTALDPFVANVTAKSVIFDPPYFDLARVPQTRGIVAWGAHDPGTAQMSRPSDLCAEIIERFGPYEAADCIYGFTWPSVDKTVEVGHKLTRAVEQRARIAQWLFSERFLDWDLGILVVSEVHSVLEPMWHGLDLTHPLHHLPSAKPAAAVVEDVYQAVDRLIGTLMSSLPDTTVVTFAMHGMGPNESDVPSMLLLPEFLYRLHSGESIFTPPPEWNGGEKEVVMLGENEEWEKIVGERLHRHQPNNGSPIVVAWRTLQRRLKKMLTRTDCSESKQQNGAIELSLNWMPTTQYRRYWPKMKAFALPAFYDGRIRINLAGREKHGVIKLEDYEAYCHQVESLLKQCRDLRTGEPVVRSVERGAGRNPVTLGPTEADLIVRWRGAPTGISHPKIGQIGPAPYRRTGGHTGQYGMAYLCGSDFSPGDYGVVSSFDIVPTLFELLGEKVPNHIAGNSLLTRNGNCNC